MYQKQRKAGFNLEPPLGFGRKLGSFDLVIEGSRRPVPVLFLSEFAVKQPRRFVKIGYAEGDRWECWWIGLRVGLTGLTEWFVTRCWWEG